MTQIKQKNGKNDKEKTKNLPTLASNLEISKQPQEATDISKQEYTPRVEILPIKESRYERRNSYAQIAMAILTFISLCVIYYMTSQQIKLTKTISDSSDVITKNSIALSDSSLRLTKRSVAIAESSNSITKKTLELAQKNFQIENRPYVGIKNITLDTFEIGKRVYFTVTYQNYGKIPALDFRGIIVSEAHTIPTYNIFQYEGSIRGYETVAVLPPLEPRYQTTSSNYELTRDGFDSIINKRLYLYVFGRYTYTDIFNGKDTTTFCAIYDPISRTFGDGRFNNKMK